MAEREVKIVIRANDRSKTALASATKGFKRLNTTIAGAVGSAAKALLKMGVIATGVFTGFAILSVKTAITVESAFAGVIKTTDGLVDEFGDLNKAGVELSKEFRELALTIPTDLPELMRLGEVGGQLGVARENLVGFTKTMAAMGEATDLTGEQAAVAFAQIANVMQTSQEDFDRMGSSVVALGNTFATNETAIVNFSQRIASAGKIAGLTEADVFGMAAAFSSVGVNAEAGGTAVQKVLIAMTQSVAEGGDQLDIFAATAGMSAEQFATAFREDAAGAFTAFVTGLGEQGDDAFGTLEMLELQDQRLIRAFLSLAGAGDLLGETIKVSNEAWDANTALAKEAEQRYNTLESQFKLVKNIVTDVALSFGEALTPFIRDALQAALPFIQEFARNLPDLIRLKVIPAINDVVEWLREKAIPALGDFVTWFKEKAIPAFGDFVEFIKLRVLPAIGNIATWLREKGIPAFQDFATFINEKILPIINTLATWLSERALVAFDDLIRFIEEKVLPGFSSFLDVISPIVEAIGKFIERLLAGKDPMLAWGALLLELVPPEAASKIFEFTKKVMDFVEVVIAFVKEHGPALQAAFIAIGVVVASAAVIGAIAGFIAVINPVTLIIAGIAGAAALLAAAWTENWGGIRDKAEEVWAKLQPIFETLKTWLDENIPKAVAVLAKIWNETLIPAFTAVWEFIRDNIIPIWVSLVELGIKFVKKEIELFLKVWAFLKPAFEVIWRFIKDFLVTAFQIFSGALTNIVTQIKTVLGWIADLIKAIDKIKLPDFLKSTEGLIKFSDLIRDMPEVELDPILREPRSPFIDPIRREPGVIIDPIRREMRKPFIDPIRRDAIDNVPARIHIENLNVSGSGSAAADVRNVVTMLEFGTRTV